MTGVNGLGAVDAKDYHHAAVELVWAFRKSVRHLVFAVVELFPHEMPPPCQSEEWTRRLGGRSDWRLFGKRVVVSASDGLYWYSRLTEGEWSIPNDGDARSAGVDQQKLDLWPSLQEPPWPGTIVCTSRALIPFMPSDHTCPRVHHLFSQEPLSEIDWSGSERQLARSEIESRLHFDLGDAEHLWQSAHLVAPNPVLRDVSMVRPDPTTEEFVVTLVPRIGFTLQGMTVVIRDDRVTGSRILAQIKDPTNEFKVSMPGETYKRFLEISCAQRGLLYQSGPCVFVAAIETRMQIGTSVRRVSAPPRKGASVDEYESTTYYDAGTIRVGDIPALKGLTKLINAQILRRESLRPKSLLQQWFDGNKNAAAQAIRERLQRGNKRVRLMDPYFSARDVVRYLPAVGQTSATLQILTSQAGLTKATKAAKQCVRYEARRLLKEIHRVVENDGMNDAEVRIMTGRVPAVHDRFICVDDEVWLVGSSLNEFGGRGTMLVKLDAAGVLHHLEAAWKQSQPADEFVAGTSPRAE